MFDDVKSIANLILNDTKEYRLKNIKCSFANVFLLPKIFYCSDLMAKVCFQVKRKTAPSKMDFNSWNIFWDIWFGVLATLITAGNILTIWIFFKHRRQKRTYSLLMSLAVADLLVGSFAVPFYIKAVVSQGYAWSLISMLADVSTGITSIYTLAVISLERIYAVGWPVRHRTVNYRVYVCAIRIPCT